nr:MAG TPA: hypothetical protein [Caudoviricetes sp.]
MGQLSTGITYRVPHGSVITIESRFSSTLVARYSLRQALISRS